MEDLDLPEIKRKKVQEKKAEDKKEFKDLFQSDSDSEDDDGLTCKGKLTVVFIHKWRNSLVGGRVPFRFVLWVALFVAGWTCMGRKQMIKGDESVFSAFNSVIHTTQINTGQNLCYGF